MDWFDLDPPIPRGGRSRDAATSVSFYHLSFRSGSRGGGACAGAAHAYITRTEEYDDPERDSAVHTESDHCLHGRKTTHATTGTQRTCSSGRTAACI